MSELNKLSFNLSDLRLFEWQNLWWYQDEIDIGFDALNTLIDSQEKTMNENIVLFEKLKDERLSEIPEEYRASYEYQFFEHSNKVNYQLRIMQRYSSCLMIFTFFENSLKHIAEEFANELEVKFRRPHRNIITETKNFLINKLKIEPKTFYHEFGYIESQRIVRNTIAHYKGFLPEDKYADFPQSQGIYLSEGEIIIKPEYLKNLIRDCRKFFNEIILSMDDRYIEVKKNN